MIKLYHGFISLGSNFSHWWTLTLTDIPDNMMLRDLIRHDINITNQTLQTLQTQLAKKCWANVITYVGATSEMTLGQRGFVHRCNVGTTFCQRSNLLHFVIFDGCYNVGTMYYEWLAKRWHNFIIAHCLSTIMININSLYERLWHNCLTNNSTYQ